MINLAPNCLFLEDLEIIGSSLYFKVKPETCLVHHQMLEIFHD